MASKDLQGLDDQALVHHVLQSERDLVDGRFKHSLNQLENTASLRVTRRGIARARTELRARELASGLGPNSLMRKHRGSFVVGSSAPAAAPKKGFLSGIVDETPAGE